MTVTTAAGNAQALASELRQREDAISSKERGLDADKRELQQQRQETELAGMKAQLAAQQQQHLQQSSGLSPLLQAPNPQLLGLRNASRLQVGTLSALTTESFGCRLLFTSLSLCRTVWPEDLSLNAKQDAATQDNTSEQQRDARASNL